MRKLRTTLALLLAFTLIAAACGNDDEGADEPPATTAGDAPPDDTTPPDDGASPGGICDAAEFGPIEIVVLSAKVGEMEGSIDDFANGTELAANTINDECGAEIVALDRIPTGFTVESMEETLLEAQEAEPDLIIGNGSSSQMVLNSLVDEGQIPLLWPVGTGTAVTGGENGSEWAFMLRTVNDTQGALIATYLADNGATNVWLECVTTQFGVSGCGAAEEIFADRGVSVAGRNDSGPAETDFTQSIVDLQAAGADAVALLQFPSPQISFTQQLEDNGAIEDVLLMGGASTEVIYQALSPTGQNETVAFAECNPRVDDPDVNATYNAAYGKDMTSLAAVVYDGIYMTVDAAIREGGSDPAQIRDGIASTTWSGVCQDYFNSGSNALAHRFVIETFADGIITSGETYTLNDDGTGF